MNDDNGRDLFASMMEMFQQSDTSVGDKVIVAKAGITFFSEVIRVAFPEVGEAMALSAASKDFMEEVDAFEKAKKEKDNG